MKRLLIIAISVTMLSAMAVSFDSDVIKKERIELAQIHSSDFTGVEITPVLSLDMEVPSGGFVIEETEWTDTPTPTLAEPSREPSRMVRDRSPPKIN